LLDAPCSFRDAALAALDRKRRAWRIVLTSPSLSGIRAAVGAGLALTVRTAAFLGDGLRRADAALRLPPLPRVGFALYAAEAAPPPAAARLKAVLVETLGDARR
jgi:DNA-binding transcriptional LysR family regulator